MKASEGPPRPAANLWEATATETVEAPPLRDHVEADAAIIGGGYTGCSAALHCAECGIDVCLLEAQTIGHGGSGRNVGLVNAGLWLPPDDVEAMMGRVAGTKLNTVLSGGPALVFSLVDRFDIACDATRTGTLHCAHSQGGLAGLRERFRQQRARGAPVELLDAAATARRSGARNLHGALLDHRAGTLQPLSYARGLARAARALGAWIHQQTRVTGIERHGAKWQIVTDHGSVRARALLVAVNAYGTESLGAWRPQFAPLHYFQLATRPLAGDILNTILPERQGAWDTAMVMSSFRLDRDGRLVLGGIGALEGFGAAMHRAWAARKLRALFPQAGAPSIEHAWFGTIAMTADRVPKVVRIGPDAFSIFGYNGRGIAPGTVLGKAFARYLASRDEAEFPLPPVPGYAARFTQAAGYFYELGATAFHVIDRG